MKLSNILCFYYEMRSYSKSRPEESVTYADMCYEITTNNNFLP